MIKKALEKIVSEYEAWLQLKEEFDSQFDASNYKALLGNIAQVDSDENLNGNIVATVVNLEEEKSLKNGPFNSIVKGATVKHNPLIHLNIFILFSATHNTYVTALEQLEKVMTFFQSKNVFDRNNTDFGDEKTVKIILDIHSLSLEQLNHLWGILGGKQYPSILYKVRLVTINAEEFTEEGVIETITDNQTVL